EIGKTAGDISRADLYLGEDVIDWTSSATVAKPTQIRAISKMRIIKPLKKGDNRARLTPEHLDLIDSRVKQSIMKNSPVDKKTIDKTETV
ncbi:MAG: hypothetical protein FWH07_05130, partial [Oscillospiraceae bacterium]|nr:hypothetical protein [Oscillospiraceae bacterium]